MLDTHTPEVARAIEDRRFKSCGFLNVLRKAWDLKANEEELRKLISLFDNWTGDRGDDLVPSVGDYLWSVVPGMNKRLWGFKLDRGQADRVYEKPKLNTKIAGQ